MNKQISILYIGNNLSNKTGYNATIAVLSSLLKERYKVTVVSNKSNKILRLVDMCWTVFECRNQIDYILIDTFSTINFYYAFIVSQMARFLKIKYIPILHGGNLPSRLKNSEHLSKMIFANSYANVAPSNYLKNAFNQKGFRVLFIPNVLTISDYNFKSRECFYPNLLWVRAFDKTYNPVMAIEVLNQLKQKYPKAKLCMIGPFKDKSHQQTLDKIKEFALEKDVEITGVLPKEVWGQKSEDFDIFINTTNFDNTPVSIMEAMALGIPIVSTNAGGLPFLINDKNEGVLTNKGDATQMAKEIVNLLENQEQTVQMCVNARKKAESFDWMSVKNQWYSLLK
ncbi:MAG: glycosyltransferase family 4 protein [Flavobacteriaceae bacterium]|nr:glycosyltransferase family 4 protein [Flavobacteriaceae bacterium]